MVLKAVGAVIFFLVLGAIRTRFATDNRVQVATAMIFDEKMEGAMTHLKRERHGLASVVAQLNGV